MIIEQQKPISDMSDRVVIAIQSQSNFQEHLFQKQSPTSPAVYQSQKVITE